MRTPATLLVLATLAGCAPPPDPDVVVSTSPSFRLRRPGPAWQFAALDQPWRPAPSPRDPSGEAVLEQVDGLAKRGRWDEAVELLQSRLRSADEPPDSRGTRAEARRRLAALPAPGRAAWERAHGQAAARAFELALGPGRTPRHLQAFLDAWPASGHAPQARELLLEGWLEEGQADAALALASELLRAPGLPPAEAVRLERLRRFALRAHTASLRAHLRVGSTARILVRAWQVPRDQEPLPAARELAEREQERALARWPGARLRAQGQVRVGTRIGWVHELVEALDPDQDPAARRLIRQALVYRPEDGAALLFTLECPAGHDPGPWADDFRRLLALARV